MKYFNQDWCDSKLDDSLIEKIQENYWKYIESIYDKLPFTIKILSKWVYFHDGFVKNLNINTKTKICKINCLLGDLQTGYFILNVKYSDAELLSNFNIKSFHNQNIEILSDEFELLSCQKYSHKILFLNKKEIEIQFSSVEIFIKDTFARVQYKCKVQSDDS